MDPCGALCQRQLELPLKHCPKDTRDLMDLINFMNFINSSIFTLLIKPRLVLIASRTGSRKRIAVFVRIVIPG